MHKITLAAVLLLATALTASASKIEGSTVLKDSQPTGTIDKEHKHQAYDLSFLASGQAIHLPHELKRFHECNRLHRWP